MAAFKIQELKNLESSATSPSQLRTKIAEVIQSSTDCHARVESLNPETGEYRVILQGTLAKDDMKR
jgi:hypothetical protein